MQHFAIPVATLKRIVDRASLKRYGISGEEFIEGVKNGTEVSGADDLTTLVKKYILEV